MGATINWASIQAKIGNVVAKKASQMIPKDLDTIAREFESTMDFTIADNSAMTVGESERVSMVPFKQTGRALVAYSTNGPIFTAKYNLFFDFVGDKTLVSLSPNKSVYNLVALFNNGYASNNVRPDAPIRGIWHGRELVIKPRSKRGANFIGRAIQEFQSWCASYYPEYKITFKVNPIYKQNT